MTRSVGAALAAVALLATGCTLSTPTADENGGGGFPTLRADIDVDTPALRDLKQEAGVEPCRPGDADPVADGLPELTLPCLGGGEDVDLSSLRGPMVVNVWASWCEPCRDELPHYQAFYEEYGDRVDVLGIDFEDTQPDAALELARDTGVTYPLLADPQSDLRSELRVAALPQVLLVAEDGTIAHQQPIEIESVAQLRSLVEEHLAGAL